MAHQETASAHTPGPWNLDDSILDTFASEGHHGFRVLYAGGRDIAYCLVTSENPDTPSEEDQDVYVANARLIRAAPELLEACEWLLFAMKAEFEEPDAVDFAKDIIAKAKGKAA